MESWNWKCECCLVFGGLMIGGPLGTLFLKKLQEAVENNALQPYRYNRLLPGSESSDGFDNHSNISLLIPSSLWFVVTTSCVGIIFWVLGDILRKIHSASSICATGTSRSRSIDAASMRVGREGGGGREGQRVGERGNGWRLEGIDDGRDPGEYGPHYFIYQLARERLIFLYLQHEQERIRLCGELLYLFRGL